jgi:hypothetical protein
MKFMLMSALVMASVMVVSAHYLAPDNSTRLSGVGSGPNGAVVASVR